MVGKREQSGVTVLSVCDVCHLSQKIASCFLLTGNSEICRAWNQYKDNDYGLGFGWGLLYNDTK